MPYDQGGTFGTLNPYRPKPKPKPTTPTKPKAPTVTAPTAQTPTFKPIETEKPSWIPDGPSGYDGGANDYYSDLLTEEQKAAQIRTQAALDRNNSYIPQVNQQSDKALQNAYILKEQNRVNLPQQLSALGYSGGATETSMLGAMTDYENSRNTIEQDRSNTLNQINQNAQQIQATGNAELADIAANYYQNLITKQQQDAATYKTDYADTVGAYAADYQSQINKLLAAGYPEDSYEIKVLKAARNQKISTQQSTQADADQQAFENYLKKTQLLYNINKPYFNPSSGGVGGMSESEIISMYNSGLIDEATARQLLGL